MLLYNELGRRKTAVVFGKASRNEHEGFWKTLEAQSRFLLSSLKCKPSRTSKPCLAA